MRKVGKVVRTWAVKQTNYGCLRNVTNRAGSTFLALTSTSHYRITGLGTIRRYGSTQAERKISREAEEASTSILEAELRDHVIRIDLRIRGSFVSIGTLSNHFGLTAFGLWEWYVSVRFSLDRIVSFRKVPITQYDQFRFCSHSPRSGLDSGSPVLMFFVCFLIFRTFPFISSMLFDYMRSNSLVSGGTPMTFHFPLCLFDSFMLADSIWLH